MVKPIVEKSRRFIPMCRWGDCHNTENLRFGKINGHLLVACEGCHAEPNNGAPRGLGAYTVGTGRDKPNSAFAG